jgi:hypothetical protein
MKRPLKHPLIPELRGKTGRFSARPEEQRKWSLAEDVVLFPVLLACDSQRAYLEACWFLCDVLDRRPVYAARARPSRERQTNDRVAIIERRTVTETLTGKRADLLPFVRTLYGQLRAGTRFTWAERDRFLKPYYDKKNRDGSVVGERELLLLLERPEDERPDVRYYFEGLEDDDRGPPENHETPRPADPARDVDLTRLVGNFVAGSAARRRQRTAWRNLHEFLYP